MAMQCLLLGRALWMPAHVVACGVNATPSGLVEVTACLMQEPQLCPALASLEFLHDLLHEGLGGPRGHLVGAGRPAGSLQAAGTVAAALHWQGRAGLPAGPACQPKQMHATACPAGVPRLL